MSGSGRLVDYLGSGVASARPVTLTLIAGSVGIYFATDTPAISLWTGSAWVAAPGGGGSGTVTNVATGTGLTGGPVTTTGTLALSSGSIASLASADSAVQSVVAGTGVTVDNTNPKAPVINASTSAGTVTSVAVSGGTTGLTTSGSPITSSGTVTLAGTLAIANGGTGATTGSAALTALGGFANPMTAVGDMIIGGTAGAPARLAQGANGTFLGVVAGVLGYFTSSASVAWGAVTGTLSSQTDLVAALAAKTALSNTSAWTKNQYVAPNALTYAATVTPDASTSNNFQLTLTGACTLANPTNLQSGMVVNFCIDQDATGGRVLTLGSLFKWAGGTVPTWVTTASAKNFFSAYYDGTILRCSGGAGYA